MTDVRLLLAVTKGTISSTKTSTLNSNPNSASTEKTTVAKIRRRVSHIFGQSRRW